MWFLAVPLKMDVFCLWSSFKVLGFLEVIHEGHLILGSFTKVLFDNQSRRLLICFKQYLLSYLWEVLVWFEETFWWDSTFLIFCSFPFFQGSLTTTANPMDYNPKLHTSKTLNTVTSRLSYVIFDIRALGFSMSTHNGLPLGVWWPIHNREKLLLQLTEKVEALIGKHEQ